MEKINETKSWGFFSIFFKSDKSLARLIKKKKIREGSNQQSQKYKKKLQQTITEIQRIIRGQYRKLYANKMDNFEEMDKFRKVQSPKTGTREKQKT